MSVRTVFVDATSETYAFDLCRPGEVDLKWQNCGKASESRSVDIFSAPQSLLPPSVWPVSAAAHLYPL